MFIDVARKDGWSSSAVVLFVDSVDLESRIVGNRRDTHLSFLYFEHNC